MEGGDLIVKVGNALEYAPQVQGFETHDPRQVRWASSYGWSSVENVAKEEWARARPQVERAVGSE